MSELKGRTVEKRKLVLENQPKFELADAIGKHSVHIVTSIV
jgi:hypothetical protein